MESTPSYKYKNLIIGIASFAAGALLAVIIFSIIARPKPQFIPTAQVPAETQGTTVNPIDALIITQDPANPDQNIATLPDFNLSFKYSKYLYSFDEDNHGVVRSSPVNPPKLEGNVISFGPGYASSLTIYDREQGQSLETAIKTMFLNNIPSTACHLVRVQAGTEYQVYAPSNQISYVVLQSLTPGGCPSRFDFSNTSSTFFSLASNPSKIFFVTGSKDAIMPLTTADGVPFWETMKFNTN